MIRKESAQLIILIIALFNFNSNVYSQNAGINITGATPDASAMLDISSTVQGMLIPRLTDAQRQALKDPATGLMIYNTGSNEINFYDGTGWQRVPGNSVSTTSAGGTGPGNGIAINNNGNPPDASARLDVSATDKGILIPRTTQGSVTAVAGLVIYNTTTNKINYYDGTSWQVPCSVFLDNNKGTGATGIGVGINATGAAPDVSAILDISSATKGLLIPRMTSAQRDAIQTPAQGLIVYNNTDNRIENWIGTAWYEWMYYVPAQPSSITGTSTLCQSQNGVAFSVVNVSGVTYTWSYSGTGFTCTSGCSSNSITADFSSTATSGILSVTPSNACGNGTTQTLSVTVNAPPTTANAGADQTLACGVSSTTLSGNSPTVGTGIWSVILGTASVTTPTSPTSAVTGLIVPAVATFMWTISNSPCPPSTATVSITTIAGGAPTSGCGGQQTMTDARDGKVYNIVQIGTQCWMAQNLDYGTFVTEAIGQGAAGTQKYCYGDVIGNCTTYGGLYEWPEMMNGSPGCNGTPSCPPCTTPVQGVCPSGWHIPSHYEWNLLEKNVGSNPGAFPYDITTQFSWLGTDEGGNLKETGTTHWLAPNTGATNTSGFTGLGAGFHQGPSSGILFFYLKQYAFFWTATDYIPGTNAWARYLYYNNNGGGNGNQVYRDPNSLDYGYSVRCVKD